MFPFFPSTPNEISPALGSNNLGPHQAVLPNPNQTAPNHQFQPQPMEAFNRQNANLNNLSANNIGFMPLNFQNGVNMQNMLQSGCMGVQQLFLQSYMANQQNMNINQMMAVALMQGQLCNASQNLSQGTRQQLQGQFTIPGNWTQNFLQNKAMSLQEGQFSSQQTMLPANNNIMPLQFLPNQPEQCLKDNVVAAQAVGFSKNPLSQPTTTGLFSNSSILPVNATQVMNIDQQTAQIMGCNAGQGSTNAAAASGNASLSYLDHNQSFQTCRSKWSQNRGSGISNVYQGNTSQSLPRQGCNKQDQSQHRFQRLQSPHISYKKGNFRPLRGNRSRGSQHGRERNLQFTRFNHQSGGTSQRSQSVNYTEQEIHQWREARKRNFPTAAKSQRLKLAGLDGKDEINDNDSLMRRQQLKDVLAKQAELGVEIAELPPNYLSDSENQNARTNDRKCYNTKGRFKNTYNKRGRRGYENRYNKRQKSKDGVDHVPGPMKRKPTLLQKLLSADIKRDKSKLLQVFRFIALNSFFNEWPERPLEFPEISAKDDTAKDLISEDAISGGVDDVSTLDGSNYRRQAHGELDERIDGDYNIGCCNDGEEEVVHEHDDKSEEGEITD